MIKHYRKHVLLFLFIFMLMRYSFNQVIIMSPSMEPSYRVGDCFLMFRPRLFSPNHGNVVSFRFDDASFMKRVIGIGGAWIEIKDGEVYRNGFLLDEPYLPHSKSTQAGQATSYQVPDGYIFVLGDNRENSYDSRYWEDPYVPVSDVEGICLCRIPFF